MADNRMIVVGDIPIAITRKRIKHVHLRVHPPDGRVTISAPNSVRPQTVEAFAAARLEWIRRQQNRVRARGVPRQFVTGKSHYLWGYDQVHHPVAPHSALRAWRARRHRFHRAGGESHQAVRLDEGNAEGPGVFRHVKYIQRVNTVGGIAPTSPGTTGEEARVPYTTEYFFYRAP